MLKLSDIVQIPFPFSDLTHQKRRPVLLLTTPDSFGDFLAVAITSQAGHEDAVSLRDDDPVEGKLPKTSWVRAGLAVNPASDVGFTPRSHALNDK